MARNVRPKEPRPRRLGNLARAVGRRFKQHYGWILALLGIVIGAIGLYVALNPDEPLTAEQQELLASIPPKVGWHCHRLEDLDPALPSFTRRIQARAECEATDPGPEEVTFSSFGSEADQRRYMRAFAAYSFKDGFICKADYLPVGRWTDATGRERGELVCADGPKHANLIWSDFDSPVHLVGYAIARLSREEELHRWWQRDVKYNGDGAPREPLRKLEEDLPIEFGHCIRARVAQADALVSVTCAGKEISALGAGLFPSVRALTTYIGTQAEGYPGATTEEGCQASPLSFTNWWIGNDQRHPQGQVLCYVYDGTQWLVWSSDRTRIYAYAARADGDFHKLWQEWSNSLCCADTRRQTSRNARARRDSLVGVAREAPTYPGEPVPSPDGGRGSPAASAGSG